MYGITIKKIRKDKSLTLKSTYQNICSKTNAIKFEKGERNLSMDKFLLVLSNLMVSIDEFLWIDNGNRPLKENYFRYMMNQLWNENNQKMFKNYVNSLAKNQVGMNKIQWANYELLKEYSENKKYNSKLMKILINYYSNLETWTIYDLKIFANDCYFLPYSFMLILLREVLKAKDRYLYFKNINVLFCTIISNCIDRMINQGDVNSAQHFLKIFDQFNSGLPMNGYKLLSKYYHAKIIFLYLDQNRGHKLLNNILYISKELDDSQIVNEIKKLLKNKGN